MTERKNKGCSTAMWILLMTACVTATIVLLILKAVGAIETTWFIVFLPIMIGAALPVVVILFAILIGFMTGLLKVEEKNDEN